jgi:hypothetical protein
MGGSGPARVGRLGEPSSSRFRGGVPTQKGRKGSVMTHVGCPNCRLRFGQAAAAYLVACPECGRPPQSVGGADRILGFRLFIPEDAPRQLPEAVSVSLPIPDPYRL